MDESPIPDADEFRKWVEGVLVVLEMRAYPLSVHCGVPVNSVKKFISGSQRSINLDTAKTIVDGCIRLASERGKVLPPLPISSDGDE